MLCGCYEATTYSDIRKFKYYSTEVRSHIYTYILTISRYANIFQPLRTAIVNNKLTTQFIKLLLCQTVICMVS